MNLEKKQYYLAIIRTVAVLAALVIIIVTAAVAIPKITASYNRIETTLTNVEEVSGKLSQEFPTMLEDVQTVLSNADDGIAQATGVVNSIDIDTLNSAINDLQTIIRPLAEFFGH